MVSSTKRTMANFTLLKKARKEQFADDPENRVPDGFCCLMMLAFFIFAYKVPAVLCMRKAKLQFLSGPLQLFDPLITTAIHFTLLAQKKPLGLHSRALRL